ncbi:MAG: bifunctional DNA-formamidopyrimidine glycosylase/DNA-(apurinic or apyrimidinic site) lyase [Ktedonobacteraceae bacterium]
MPELPEVEHTARQLRAGVVGATISDAQVFWERAIGHPEVPDFLAEIADRRILNVRRRGKYLVLDLSGELILTIHRRMTGNLLLLPPGWKLDTSLRETDPAAWDLKGPAFNDITPYCRVSFNLADGRCLLFTDPRKFGRIELWPAEREEDVFSSLGPEPLDADFTVERLSSLLAGRKIGIKQALLMQEVVAGLGNIYADEALYYASIHPLRRANSLTACEIRQLHAGIIAVLTLGIEYGGTSFSGYRDLAGEEGNNYDHLRAYHKHGTSKICERCGTQIERMVIAQRSAHFCPTCQQITGE